MLVKYQTAADEGIAKVNAGSTISVRGALGSETITVQIPDGAGGWEDLYEDGGQVILDATHMQITAYGHTLVKVLKPATTNSVGVTVVG